MNYGISFTDFLQGMESTFVDDDYFPAMETLTLTQQQRSAQATDKKAQDDRVADKKQKHVDPNTGETDFQAVLQEMTEKANTSVVRAHETCLAFLNNTWKSNEEWIAQYNEMKDKYKLQKELVVINWTYGHNAQTYLGAKIAKLRSTLQRNVSYLSNPGNAPDNSLIVLNGHELEKAVLAELGAPSSIESMKEYLGHMRAQFRGRKGEKRYSGEMAERFANEVRSFAKTKTSYSQDINAADRLVKAVSDNAKRVLSSNSADEKTKRAIIKNVRTLYKVIATYCNLVYFSYRMETEYILNRRVVATKLFEK